jgi:hypothetical protein
VVGPLRASADALRLQGGLAAMAWQAAMVVPLRLSRLAADLMLGRPAASSELTLMVTEKVAAAASGVGAATARALRGGDAVSVALAAIGPARRAVRANARRLVRG